MTSYKILLLFTYLLLVQLIKYFRMRLDSIVSYISYIYAYTTSVSFSEAFMQVEQQVS